MDSALDEKPVFFEYSKFPSNLATMQVSGIVKEGVVNPGAENEYVYFFLATSMGSYLLNEYYGDEAPTINPTLTGEQARQLNGARVFVDCQTSSLDAFELNDRSVYAKAKPMLFQAIRIKRLRVNRDFVPGPSQ
jgi:hypothetical protein